VNWLDDCKSSEALVNLWKLYVLFPSVTSLSIKLCWDPNTLQSCWTFWTGLEELEIYIDSEMEYLDSAFTGDLQLPFFL